MTGQLAFLRTTLCHYVAADFEKLLKAKTSAEALQLRTSYVQHASAARAATVAGQDVADNNTDATTAEYEVEHAGWYLHPPFIKPTACHNALPAGLKPAVQ